VARNSQCGERAGYMAGQILRLLLEKILMLRTLFPCCEHLFPCCEHFFHVAPPLSFPDIVYMLRAMLRVCGEHVASLW
jgi:hypothetical protein